MITGKIAATLVVFISLVLTQLCYAKLNTYVHTLDNGQNITCNLCPPGYHWQDHCTINGGDSKCSACTAGFFSPEYNQWVHCARCGKECDSRETVTSLCTSVSNISCKCQEGYYRESGHFGVCREISPCQPGEGVITPGNETANTQCKVCEKGYFSANFSTTDACEKCSVCPGEMVVYKPCQPDADTDCRSRYDLPTDATVIGIVVGVLFMIGVIVTLLCCLCFMKERCAALRKKLCRCCYRPYQECTQNDQSSITKSAAPGDVKVYMPPDLIRYTHNGVGGDGVYKQRNGFGVTSDPVSHSHSQEKASAIDKNIFYKLREDLIIQDYPQFFRFLFTKDADCHIEEMKMNFHTNGVKEIIYQILVRWRDIEEEEATPEKILEALQDWNRMDLHKKYSDMFSCSDVQMDSLKQDKVTTEV